MSPLRFLPRHLRRLAADQRGVSAIEMALLAPVLAIFTVSIGDLGRAFAERYALQQAIHRALEMGLQTGPSGGNYLYLRAEAATAAGIPIEDVTVNEWAECTNAAGVRRRETTTAACAAGTSTTAAEEFARYVEIQISCTYTPMFSGMPFSTRNADGSVPLNAEGSVRVQ